MSQATDQLNRELNALETFRESEAFKAFFLVMVQAYETSLKGAMETSDPMAMARFMGAAKATKDLSTWVEREIYARQHALNEMKNQK